MRTLRALARLALTVLHALHGVAIVLLAFRRMDRAARHARIRWWADKMLRVMGVRRVVEGMPHTGATLLAANHVSWLDIVALHSVCPQARFVSKADVKHWPLINRLVDAADTLYIERERKRDAMRVVHQIAEALKRGEMVAVFPEGTTGDGHALLPFHANLLQAAIAVEAPVQPVALRFSEPGHKVSPAAAYVGDTTLLQSVWRIACAEALTVHLRLLPALGTRHADRRALAERVRESIAESL
ncbi:MAG: lysophospholipid acyltransferase family protein [Pseudomonadota bacterium]